MSKSSSQTIGYEYSLGMHVGFCHGPIDRITRIRFDKRTAWCGNNFGGRIDVSARKLFGGKKREGGVAGAIDFEPGDLTQTQNDYLATQLTDGPLPSFRNIAALVFRQFYFGMSPYLKPLEVRAQRIYSATDGVDQWYPEKAGIRGCSVCTLNSAVYIAMDLSGSMAGARLSFAKTAINGFLDYLQSLVEQFPDGNLDVMIVGWGGDGASLMNRQTITRREVDSTAISDLKSWVSGRSATYFTHFPSAVADASAFFSGAADGASRISLFVTDGYPNSGFTSPFTPEEEAISQAHAVDAGATLLGISGVQAYAFNIVLTDTTWSSYLDNTPNDGVPVVSDSDPDSLEGVLSAAVAQALDMNPAHLIREVLTDKAWGMGYPESDIDDASFTAAADQLYSEQMGISILWDRQQSIQDFLDLIVQHIDATIYVSRATGKFVLKLIRNDYTAGSLLTLGTDEVQGVENFAAPAQGDLISSVSAIYWDCVTGEQASVTVHDQALAVQQGAVVGTTSQYPGFTNRRIASQVAYRDLRALSVPLRSCTVYANRVASSLNPGDVFRLDWPDISADPIIMRVTGIALGDGRSNRVRITCVEDVFSLGDAPIAQDVPSKWQDPAGRPVAPDARLVFEAPYYAIARQEGETVANQFLAAQPTAGWLMTTAKRPGSAINLDVFVDPGTGYVEEYVSDFSPWAVLTAAAGPTDTVLAVGSVADLSDAVVGQLALLGSELVRIDVVTDTAITVGRGCLDTVPASHAIGVNLVLWQDFADIGPTVYDEGEAINVKLLPNSGGAQVAIASVTADTLTFAQRAYRPYPPGLFKINGEAYPTFLDVPNYSAADAISVSWAHRDRLQQTGGTVADTTAANIGPEAATTYTAQLINTLDNSVFASTTGITGTSADFAITGYAETTLRVKLLAVRSALNSYQTHDWTFLLSNSFTPESITTASWIDASDSSTITLVSGAVSVISDKSGNARNTTQTNSANRPVVVSADLNGLDVIAFDGTSGTMEMEISTALFQNLAGAAIFIVYKFTSGPGTLNAGVVVGHNNAGSTRLGIFGGATSGKIQTTARRLDGDTGINALAATDYSTGWVIQDSVADWTGGNLYNYVNGALDGSNTFATAGNTSNTAANQRLRIAGFTGSSNFAPIRIGEIVILQSTPTLDIRQKMEGYLAHKWGLTANLPSGHPYKSVAPTV